MSSKEHKTNLPTKFESMKSGNKMKKDSFRQNASSAEKNLLKESMFFLKNDEHDVKMLTRELKHFCLKGIVTITWYI